MAKNQIPMSHPEYKLSLSKKAQEDFEDILLYTLQAWGEEQMYVYRDDILNPAVDTHGQARGT